jgi:hypothetical protein
MTEPSPLCGPTNDRIPVQSITAENAPGQSLKPAYTAKRQSPYLNQFEQEGQAGAFVV